VRFFKKTIFWVIIMAVIGGLFYLMDRQVEEKKTLEEEKKKVFPFEPQDVNEFQIIRGGENILLRKEGDDWFMESPFRAVGDKNTVQKLLEGVVKAKIDGILFENQPVDKLREMGITDSPTSLTLHLRTSSRILKTIVFGDRNPGMNLGFAILKDDPRIFRLTADIKAEADKTVFDLRDKAVMNFQPLKSKGFEIKWNGGETITVDHPSEGKWHITRPAKGIANPNKITEILYKIKESRIKAFIDEEPKDLSPYGLSNPRLKISIIDEHGKKIELLVGEKEKKQRGLFAKREDAKNVFLLEEDFILPIPKSSAELEETRNAGQK